MKNELAFKEFHRILQRETGFIQGSRYSLYKNTEHPGKEH